VLGTGLFIESGHGDCLLKVVMGLFVESGHGDCLLKVVMGTVC
jgi:hypothetical protein